MTRKRRHNFWKQKNNIHTYIRIQTDRTRRGGRGDADYCPRRTWNTKSSRYNLYILKNKYKSVWNEGPFVLQFRLYIHKTFWFITKFFGLRVSQRQRLHIIILRYLYMMVNNYYLFLFYFFVYKLIFWDRCSLLRILIQIY